MTSSMLGTWDLILGEAGRGEWIARLEFSEREGRLVVRDADPDSAGSTARVDVTGDRARFELLSAGSSRGNTHHTFDLEFSDDGTLRGTRRRGMLTRAPLIGRRIAAAAPPATVATVDDPAPTRTALDPLTEARMRAAAAAERASLAAAEAEAALAAAEELERTNLSAAEAAAALAEAEAAEALEAARIAAAKVAATRAALQALTPAGDAVAPPTAATIPKEVLSILPAPVQQPMFAAAAPPLTAEEVLDDTAATTGPVEQQQPRHASDERDWLAG